MVTRWSRSCRPYNLKLLFIKANSLLKYLSCLWKTFLTFANQKFWFNPQWSIFSRLESSLHFVFIREVSIPRNWNTCTYKRSFTCIVVVHSLITVIFLINHYYIQTKTALCNSCYCEIAWYYYDCRYSKIAWCSSDYFNIRYSRHWSHELSQYRSRILAMPSANFEKPSVTFRPIW